MAPTSPPTLYAALDLYSSLEPSGQATVYRSRDDGVSWQPLGDGGSLHAGAIRSLAVDPHDPRRIIAGTATRGILTWTEP